MSLSDNTPRMFGFMRIRLVTAACALVAIFLIGVVVSVVTSPPDLSVHRKGCVTFLGDGLEVDSRCRRYDFYDEREHTNYTLLDLEGSGSIDAIRTMVGEDTRWYYAPETPFAAFVAASPGVSHHSSEVVSPEDLRWQWAIDLFDTRKTQFGIRGEEPTSSSDVPGL